MFVDISSFLSASGQRYCVLFIDYLTSIYQTFIWSSIKLDPGKLILIKGFNGTKQERLKNVEVMELHSYFLWNKVQIEEVSRWKVLQITKLINNIYRPQGCTNLWKIFIKVLWRQNPDTKMFPYGIPKHFRCISTKFSHSATLRPVLCTRALRFNWTEILDTALLMDKLIYIYIHTHNFL